MREGDDHSQHIKIVIADRDTRSRKALGALLGASSVCHVIGEAQTGSEALNVVQCRQPDIVLLDADLPAINTRALTRIIKASWPDIRVIVLSNDTRAEYQAREASADAFLDKRVAAERLIATVHVLGNSSKEQQRHDQHTQKETDQQD